MYEFQRLGDPIFLLKKKEKTNHTKEGSFLIKLCSSELNLSCLLGPISADGTQIEDQKRFHQSLVCKEKKSTEKAFLDGFW